MDREGRFLEYKEEVNRSFLKTVTAFANFDGGQIIFGVDDNREIIGLEDPIDQALNIENMVNNSIDPVPLFWLDVDEERGLVYLNIEEGLDKPYRYKGKAYKRADTSTIELSRLEVNRLVLEGGKLSFDSLTSPKQDLSFDTLEEELVRVKGIEGLSLDNLRTLNLYSKEGGFNYAALLLAEENDMPGLDWARMGDSWDIFLGRGLIEGQSLFDTYHQGLDLYRSFYQYEQVRGIRRERIERIPELAFREALVNALVHRAWDLPAKIQLALHPDRIDISSPGGLVKGMSEEEYLRGGLSVPRNPILANVFFTLGYIEAFGTGIQRIRRYYSGSLLQPKFEVLPESIRISLPIFESLDPAEDEDLIYSRLGGGQSLSRREIEDLTGLTRASVLKGLNKLMDQGLVKRLGSGPSTRYKRT